MKRDRDHHGKGSPNRNVRHSLTSLKALRPGELDSDRQELAGKGCLLPESMECDRSECMSLTHDSGHMSPISGYQPKVHALVNSDGIRLTQDGGTHFFKPSPSPDHLKRAADVPANEHVTMLVAKSIYGMKTALCGLIRMGDGGLAYITKRFDKLEDGQKLILNGMTATLGIQDKFQSSYEEVLGGIRGASTSPDEDVLAAFTQIVFSYLVANEDLHLKNMSMLGDQDNSWNRLSPAYDLLCSRIHVSAPHTLPLQFFIGSDVIDPSGCRHPTAADFLDLAIRADIPRSNAAACMAMFVDERRLAGSLELIANSFLSDESKTEYGRLIRGRHKRLTS